MSSDPAGTPATAIAVINYNGADVLPATLAAVADTVEPGTSVMLIDDGSDDGSPEWVEATYPWVDVVRMGRNTGRPNLLRSLALERATTPLVFLLDNDVVLQPGCLRRLREVLTNAPDAACCTPRLVFRDAPDTIYVDGGGLHYLCLSTSMARGANAASRPAGGPRDTIGCGIMLLDRDRVLELGGFDEGYLFGWGDDGEFHFRSRIAGFRVLHVPSAVGEHVPRRDGEPRIFAQLYNRYRLLATGYSLRSLVLLSPALLAFELALTVFAVAGGVARLRFRALGRVLRERRELARRRSEVQEARRRPDGEVLVAGDLMRPHGHERSRLVDAGIALVTGTLDAYWRLVRRWM